MTPAIWCYVLLSVVVIGNCYTDVNGKVTDENISFFGESDNNDKYIFLNLGRLGLGNRLKALGDWYQVATLTNRILLVNWVATYDCNAKFSDLFESGPSKLRILPFSMPEAQTVLQTVQDIAESMGHSAVIWKMNFTQGSTVFADPDIFMSDIRVVITAHDGAISLKGIQCANHLIAHSSFLSSLVPIGLISQYVRTVADNYFYDTVVIGVHYRAHNSSQDWNVVPPQFGAKEAVAFGEGAEPSLFVDVMSGIENKFTVALPNGKIQRSLKFFIASNSHTVKEQFMGRFPHSVALSGEYDRATLDGVQFALVEWLLLSKCSLIVNTYGSSFAAEAAQVNLRPLVGIWGSHLIHHSSMSLPYCGLPQFLKEYGGTKQPMRNTTYKEGTKDNRNVSKNQCNNNASCPLTLIACAPVVYGS